MSAIGILGGLAAAGAAYKEGQRNKKREARLEKYDSALADLRTAQAEQLRAGIKPKASTAMMVESDREIAYPAVVADPDDSSKTVPHLAHGGVVGYANGGYVGNVMDCSDSSWQRQSFKK